MNHKCLSWIMVGCLAVAVAAAGLFWATAAPFNSPVVPPLAVGQANFGGNSTADAVDLLLLLGNWHQSATGLLEDYDLDGSGDIGHGDLWLFALDWQKSAPREGVPSYIVGQAFSAADGQPLAHFEVLLLGEDAWAETFSNGEYTYEVLLPEEQRLTQVIIEVRAENMTYAHRKSWMFPGETMTVEPVYLVPVDTNVTEIGPEGGTYISSDAAIEITIPPGALNTTVGVTSARFPFGKSLPGPLPDTSHFTFAHDLYPEVQFATDVVVRAANDLGFAPGTPIPFGVYDREQACWVADGMCQVSDDGKWVEYKTKHFTPFDCNVPSWPRPGRRAPGDRRNRGEETDREPGEEGQDEDDCEDGHRGHSYISSRTGHFRQYVELPSYRSGEVEHTTALEYASDAASPNAVIAVNNFYSSDPDDLEKTLPPDSLEFTVSFLGKRKQYLAANREGFSRYGYWAEARDATGEWVPTGVYRAEYSLAHNYYPEYALADYFGGPPTGETGVRVRDSDPIQRTTDYTSNVPVLNLRQSPVGPGWTVRGLQRLYPNGRGAVLLVEGTRKKVFNGYGTIRTVAGTQWYPSSACEDVEDGMPADRTPLYEPKRLVFDATGNLYVSTNFQIIRFDRNWRGYRVAGRAYGSGTFVDGMPARDAPLRRPVGLAFDAAGDLYVAAYSDDRVFRIDTDGRMWHVAGTSTYGSSGDGGPATEADLARPDALLFDDEGNLYIACSALSTDPSRIRKVDRNGIITTFVGGGTVRAEYYFEDPLAYGEGLHRNDLAMFQCSGMQFGPGGDLYFMGSREFILRADRNTGLLSFIAGTTDKALGGVFPQSGPAYEYYFYTIRDISFGDDGSLYITNSFDHSCIVKLDADQRISPVAGIGLRDSFGEYLGDGLQATSATLNSPDTATLGPKGNLYIADTDHHRVRMVNYGFPHGATREYTPPYGEWSRLLEMPDGTYTRLMPDGTKVRFNAEGLQTHTISIPGVTTTYKYDDHNRLAIIRDPHGLETRFVYEGDRLASIVDPAGRTTSLSHDAQGDLVTVDFADDSTQSFAYDSGHRMIEKRDSLLTTRYHYDRWSRIEAVDESGNTGADTETLRYEYQVSQTAGLVNDWPEASPFNGDLNAALEPGFDRVTRPDGGMVEQVTDLSGRVRSVTNELGNSTRYWWKAECKRPSLIRTPGGGEFEWYKTFYETYTLETSRDAEGGAMFTYWDPEGRPYRYLTLSDMYVDIEYDTAGNVTLRREHVGNFRVTEWEYDSMGRVIGVTDPIDEVTTYAYDEGGRVTRKTDFRGVTEYEYDAAGNVTAVTAPSGQVTRYAYDAWNRKISEIDSTGREILLTYDGAGRVMSATAPDTGEVQFHRDARGRVVEVNYPALEGSLLENGETGPRFAYDVAGNLVAVTDAGGNTMTLGYDTAGNLIAATDAEGHITHYAYTADGDVAAVTDPTGYAINFNYDLGQRLVGVAYPDDTTRTFSHTDFHKPEMMTNRRGETIDYEYNRAGEPSQRTLPDGTRLLVEHDARGRITRVGRVDAVSIYNNLVNYRYKYTADDQVSQVRETVRGMQLDMEYACCGNLSHMMGPGDLETWFEYDDAGRLIAMGNLEDGTTTFEYGGHRWPIRVVHPNGVETIYTYTPRRSVESITVQRGPGDVLAQWTYTYDANQNPLSIETLEGSHVYTHDAMNRLLTADHPGGQSEIYDYDAVGNRISSHDIALYQYSPTHRLLGYGSVQLEYDADGNLATRTDPSGVTTYTHDPVNRLVGVDLPGGATAEYTYDGWHYRHSKTVSGETTYYLYAPQLMGEYDEAGNLLRGYLRHPRTGRVLRYHENGETYFVHNDRLGTPHLITDAAGNVVWRATYDSFGLATVDPLSTLTFNLRLPGQYYDEETGLHYNQKRYYEPDVGRFIEPDPLASIDDPLWYRMIGRTEYVYASNSPLSLSDPFGLCDECDECSSGRWTGSSLAGDAMILLVGGAISSVEITCVGNNDVFALFSVRCLRFGGGLGLGGSVNTVESRGCTAQEAMYNFAGSGAFISSSVGIVSAGAGTSTETWGVWGAGVGLGLGLELAMGGEYCWVDP